MTILKLYRLRASATHAPALRAALGELAARVRAVPGAISVNLYQDAGDPHRFTMIEQWASPDAHRASGGFLGKDAFGAVMALLREPPQVYSLVELSDAASSATSAFDV